MMDEDTVWYLDPIDGLTKSTNLYKNQMYNKPERVYSVRLANDLICKLHRENGPSAIGKSMKRWHWFGKPHRTDGPAVIQHLIKQNSYEERIIRFWYIDGWDISGDVEKWIIKTGINTNFAQWSASEKLLYKMKFA